MNKTFSLALLILGVVLALLSLNTIHSFSSALSTILMGLPTEHAVWLLLGGVLLTSVGLVSLLRKGRVV